MSNPVTTYIRIQLFGREYFNRPWFHGHIRFLLDALQFNPATDPTVFYPQHTPDLSQLSNLRLSVRCRAVSLINTADKYIVDLNTLQISDSDHDSEPRDVASVQGVKSAAMQLREYAHSLLKKNYRDQLIKYGVIIDSTPFLQVDLLTCPSCHTRLKSCADCDDVVACPDRNCPASETTEGHWCDDDRTTLFCCRQCLDTKGFDATLAQCPTCQRWRKATYLDWCFGRYIHPTLSHKELASLPDSDRDLIERSHPRKPGPCPYCIDADPTLKWHYCNGDIGVCPTKPRSLSDLQGCYCLDCKAEIQGWGRDCVCGNVWTCDVCTGDHKYTASLYTICPQCRRTFCFEYGGCEYCQICCTCKKPRLCDDCIEEEATLAEDQASAITLVDRCNQCRSPICDDCSPRKLTCYFCKNRVCGGCTSPRHCRQCEMPICTRCFEYPPEDASMCPPNPGKEREFSGLVNHVRTR